MPSKSTTPVQSRLSHDERAWAEQQAAARNVTLSAFLRTVVQRAMAGTPKAKAKAK